MSASRMPATSPARVFLSYRPPACQRAPCRAGRERPPCDRTPGLWKRHPHVAGPAIAAQQDDLGIDFPPPPICTQFPPLLWQIFSGSIPSGTLLLALWYLLVSKTSVTENRPIHSTRRRWFVHLFDKSLRARRPHFLVSQILAIIDTRVSRNGAARLRRAS